MITLFENSMDMTYLDVGHDVDSIKTGYVEVWAAHDYDDDIIVNRTSSPGQGHNYFYRNGYDYFGRIDHRGRIISFSKSYDNLKRVDYFKSVLKSEYPGYKIIDL